MQAAAIAVAVSRAVLIGSQKRRTAPGALQLSIVIRYEMEAAQASGHGPRFGSRVEEAGRRESGGLTPSSRFAERILSTPAVPAWIHWVYDRDPEIARFYFQLSIDGI